MSHESSLFAIRQAKTYTFTLEKMVLFLGGKSSSGDIFIKS